MVFHYVASSFAKSYNKYEINHRAINNLTLHKSANKQITITNTCKITLHLQLARPFQSIPRNRQGHKQIVRELK